jgi:UDP-glucose 4-epimerase
MRILVTGGAGFIGSHIVDDLVRTGHEVLVADDLSTGKSANLPPGAELAEVDIATPRFLAVAERFQPEAITHCAAQASVVVSMADPVRDARTNILGGIQVIQAAIASRCPRLVYITTGGALYGTPQYNPMDETHPIQPASPYGFSKWSMECYGRILLPASTPPRVLRLANVYGPRQDPLGEAGVVAIFGSRMLAGKPVTIYGDGEQTRDFVYVGDVVRAHALALTAPAPFAVNVGTGQATSVNALFKAMALTTGHEKPPVYAPERPGELKHVTLDASLARKQLGWEAETSLADGLRRTFDWLKRATPAVQN